MLKRRDFQEGVVVGVGCEKRERGKEKGSEGNAVVLPLAIWEGGEERGGRRDLLLVVRFSGVCLRKGEGEALLSTSKRFRKRWAEVG